MTTTGNRILTTALILGGLGYLGWRWWKNYSFSDKYAIALKGRAFKITGFHSGNYAFLLSITNKFGFDVTLVGYNLTISVNGNKITTASSSAKVNFPNNQATEVYVSGTFDPLGSLKTLANLQALQSYFASPQSVKINVSGYTTIDVKGIDVNIPVNIDSTLADYLPTNN